MTCKNCGKETDNWIGKQHALDFVICEECFISVGYSVILGMLYVNLKPRLRTMVDKVLADIGVVVP